MPFWVARFHLDIVALASSNKSADSKTARGTLRSRVISLKAKPYEIKQRDTCVARCNVDVAAKTNSNKSVDFKTLARLATSGRRKLKGKTIPTHAA